MQMKTLFVPLCLSLLLSTPSSAATTDTAKTQAPSTRPSTQPQDMEQSLMAIQSQMNHMFDNLFNAGAGPGWGQVTSYSPAVNIADNGNKFVVTFDLPGFDIKDIVASINGNTLTVSSNLTKEKVEKGKSYLRRESAMSSFERVVELPDTADIDKADATYKNGELTVTFPKVPEGRKISRQLEIKPAG